MGHTYIILLKSMEGLDYWRSITVPTYWGEQKDMWIKF